MATEHVPVSCGLALGTVVYTLAHFLELPGLRYLPESGQWTFSPPTDVIAMSYYGLVLYGVGAYFAGLALGKLIAPRMDNDSAARAVSVSATAATLAALVYFAVVELHVLG